MMLPLLSVTIQGEHDVVGARQRARQLAARLGFDAQEQTRVATAVSEIARNAFRYAGGGTVDFAIEGRTPPQVLLIRVSDHGPGIPNLAEVLEGRYRSSTGMGRGIIGARRLVDQFHVESSREQGTVVSLRKLFPKRAPGVRPEDTPHIAAELARQSTGDPLREIQQQNQELLRALGELRARQDELEKLNGELEDTNRGVVALYAELEEKADHLRRADELKSRFLSNMTHEFRTPVNSMLALCRLLLDRSDGDLNAEQEKQVAFIRKAAEDLSELVNDLLDLAKVEAGRIDVHPTDFEVQNLFGALRGMLRPLLVSQSVSLVFDEPRDIPTLHTDESKVSQILRNFISNALKFTEHGEVRVSATFTPEGEAVVFSVKDTGIGIAPEDQERIFHEFTQIDSPLQRRVRGTGLGLPLSRKLAELLGGRVAVESAPGAGSTFSAVIPVRYGREEAEPEPTAWEPEPDRLPVLVVDDDVDTVGLYRKFLKDSEFQVVSARSIREARQAMSRVAPKAIVLDILLKGEDAWAFLAEVKADPAPRVPVIVATTVEDPRKGFGLGADAYAVKPIDREWLLATLRRLVRYGRPQSILVVDDDAASRYVLRQLLRGPARVITEASGGVEALEQVRKAPPDVVFLDLVMPGLTGFEVLEQLKADPKTHAVPVIVVTAKKLDAGERQRLERHAAAVLSKEAAAKELAADVLERTLLDAGVVGR